MRAGGAFVSGLVTGVVGLYVLLSMTGGMRGPDVAQTPAPVVVPGSASSNPVSPAAPLPGPSASPMVQPSSPTFEPTPEPFITMPAFVMPPAPPPTLNIHANPRGDPAPQAPVPKESMHPPAIEVTDLERLRSRGLVVPVVGVGSNALRDTFAEMRGTRVHEAMDILAPRGTPVVAIGDGVVKKLFNSARGGLTVYQFDNEGVYCYYYAHLDQYAPGLVEGKMLRKGDPVGTVGTTGNAPPLTPHLHFTIFKLGPEKKWWEGTALNPYPLLALK